MLNVRPQRAPSTLRLPALYRERAEQVRATAHGMSGNPRQMMLELADHWDGLALQAEHLNEMDGLMLEVVRGRQVNGERGLL